MDLVALVGVPIVSFILGYYLGYRGVLDLVEASVRAGYRVGQETLAEQLRASVQASPWLPEVSEENTEDKEKMISFGFDLSKIPEEGKEDD